MERATKRDKPSPKIDPKLEKAITNFDCVDVEDILSHGANPTLENNQGYDGIDILFDAIRNEDDLDGDIETEEDRLSVLRWSAARIFESLLKHGAKIKLKKLGHIWRSGHMMLITVMYNDVKFIEELLGQGLMESYDTLTMALVLNAAQKKGVDLLKDINLYPHRNYDDMDLPGVNGSIYRFMAFQKIDTKTDLFDKLLQIANEENIRQGLTGNLPEPLHEGERIHTELPEVVLSEIAKRTKGGKKNRKSTKRKIIKHKKHKIVFNRKNKL